VLDISAGEPSTAGKTLALPVHTGSGDDREAVLTTTVAPLPAPLLDEIHEFLADLERGGAAGSLNTLPRPGRDPGHVLLVGVGQADEAGWRSAGAAVVRAASSRHTAVTLPLPADGLPVRSAARAVAEGAWLASYRFGREAPVSPAAGAKKLDGVPRTRKLRRITLATGDAAAASDGIAEARAIADAVTLARDLTNTSGQQKSPRWLADRVSHAAARRVGVTVTVIDEAGLADGGFGGILAVGAGSARSPRMVELSWRPRRPESHVVLVGKGITFDSGGISIKTAEGMKLMRKDMGGAAAVCAAVLGAADLELPVRVTALAPLAENMISGSALRPGDVVRHYGGLTTEVHNTDAEGRIVLGDALAYATRRLRPDVIVDLATLTGHSHVALGKRTAALFTHDDELARALCAAGDDVGERMWRLPLPDEYVALLSSDVADLSNSSGPGHAGAVTAALYLREFTGKLRERWAHIDMSAPAWTETDDGLLVKGATGWGVRMLLRWLAGL
jgi:leucyl aminopeptidase